MNIGMYQSAAALSALERWQDAVSQNISNSQEIGYKKKVIEFSGTNAGRMQTSSNDRLSQDEGRPAIFPRVNFSTNFQAGETSPTRRDLDVAIQGEGFFELKMPDDTKAYTRVGDFHLRPDRTLVSSGDLELLVDGGDPIKLPPGSGAITITRDGTIQQGNTRVGKIIVYKFEDNSRLAQIGGGKYRANGQVPEAVEKPDLLQGNLEQSNVTALREMIDLVTISRAYEANQKMISSRDQSFEKALEALG